MKHRFLMLCACFCLTAQDKPPVIEYKLQFEARTLEAKLRELQVQFASLQKLYSDKLDEMQKVCGNFYRALDAQSSEYICTTKPESTRNPSGTWKGVSPPPKKDK